MKPPLSLVHRSQTPSFKLPEQNTVASAKMLPNCIEKKGKLRFLNPPPPPLAARLSKLLPLAQKLETLENLILKQKNDISMITMIEASTISRIRNRIAVIQLLLPLLVLLFSSSSSASGCRMYPTTRRGKFLLEFIPFFFI